MNTRKIAAILISGTMTALSAGMTPALADDAKPGENWQGPYGGLALGGAYSAANPDSSIVLPSYFSAGDDTQLNPILQRDIDGWDVTGALLAGYDWQFGNITYGLEGDLSLMDFSESENTSGIYDTNGENFTTSTTVETNFAFSLRPKIGYVQDKFQIYAALGPSISRFKTTHRFTDTTAPAKDIRFSDTKTAFGISSSIGAGYLLNDGWVVRGDYVFSYYPDILDGSSNVDAATPDDIKYDSAFQSHNIRFALIKRF
ncbi:outer membrane protein [Thalassospira alkalitolerans]|uniref:outer membrane protein n=1 Tax=Thalassospira alkalitolerans TaxID=1293890 RepID=UPI0030EC5E7D|tara:strand:+ start:13302 stop:14075 length:774 start_codon:yes stop_codon:yes gene_type:complete